MSKQIGAAGEDAAKEYLLTQGLTWLASNYSCRFGEVDLVMRDGRSVVFVEVRQRRSMDFGGALASVTWHKQNKLIKTAQHFLMMHKQLSQNPCRIDVLTLQGIPPIIGWIKNAISQ